MFSAVHDLQAPNNLLAEVHDHRFGDCYGETALAEHWSADAVPRFTDRDVRDVGMWLFVLDVDGQALVHAGAQILREPVVQLFAGMNQNSGMHISPVLLQPRVHARKRIFHGPRIAA